MGDPASGANAAHPFNPASEIGYYISEDVYLELTLLFAALSGIAQLADTPPGKEAPEIEPKDVAPLFLIAARTGQRLLEQAVDSFPARCRGAACA